MLLYASTRRLEGWVYLEVGGPVELLKWRSASTLEAAPMWVSPTQLLGRSVSGEELLRDFKISCVPSNYNIKNYKHTALKKLDRNCSVFAIRHWEMFLKASGQLLDTAKRV